MRFSGSKQIRMKLDLVVHLFILYPADWDFVPNAFMKIVQNNFCENFYQTNREGEFYAAGDKKRNYHGVQGAGQPPRYGLDNAPPMSFSNHRV